MRVDDTLIELPFTLQHDREFVIFRFYFPLFIKPETHKGLKRVTLRCLLCPMLVIIHFLEREEEITEQSNFVNNVTWFYFSFPRPLKKWQSNGGNIFIQNAKS